MEDFLKEEGYVKEDFTGSVDDMYPGNKTTEQKTLANTIGVVNNNTGGLSALMHALPNNNDTNATKIYTITEAFGLIINELDKLEARVRSQEDFEETQKNANKGLSSRIAVLEAEHGIEDSE
jgi:hypothetical protein